MIAFAASKPVASRVAWSVVIPGVIFAFAAVVALGLIVERRARLSVSSTESAPGYAARGVLGTSTSSSQTPPPAKSPASPAASSTSTNRPPAPVTAEGAGSASASRPSDSSLASGSTSSAAAARLSGVPGNPQGALAVADRALSDEPSGLAPPAAANAARSGFVEPEQASRIWLLFTRVNQAGLAELKGASPGGGVDGAVAYGTMDQMETRLRNLADAKNLTALETSSRFDLRNGELIAVTKGKRDDSLGVTIGLTIQILPGAVDRQGTPIQLESLSTAKEASGSLAEMAHRLQLNIPKGHGAWVSGLIPRRPVPSELIGLYNSHSVLRLIPEPDFQSGQAELVVFLQPR